MDIEDEDQRRREIQEILRNYFIKHPDQYVDAKREMDEFSLEDKFRKGFLTLNDMDWLITNNLKRAEALGLRLSWRIAKDAVYGQIFDQDTIIFETPYSKGYIHSRITEMQFDFDYALSHWENFDDGLEDGI